MIFKTIWLAYRSLSKSKTFALFNVLSLTLGITVSLMIFIFVTKERSVDEYIPEVDKVFCLTNGGDTYLSYNMVNLVKEEIPELESVTFCTVDWSPQIFLERDNRSYKVDRMLTADSCFFRVFQFQSVWGNPVDALNSANKLVITRSLSKKIFGDENPVGKSVIYNATYLQNQELEIGAVVEDLPHNSSWDFEAVISFQTNFKIEWYDEHVKEWGTRNYKGFVRIGANTSLDKIKAKLESISLDKVPDDFVEKISFSLFPFSRVYFDLPELSLLKHGNRITLSIIGITGMLILLLTCVNYINIITAQREKWYKNVGLLKTLGGSRISIIGLLTTETVLLLLLAFVFSVIVGGMSLSKLNHLTNSQFTLSGLLQMKYLIIPILMLLFMAFLTGIVPGYIVSKQSPSLLLKKQLGQKRNFFRNTLLIFQFSVSVALVASILVIHRQNSFLQSRDPGFARENILFFILNDDIYKNIDVFKNELERIPGVLDYTFSESLLTNNGQNWVMQMINKGEKDDVFFSKLSVAPNFFNFFGIEIVEGSGFDNHSDEKQDFIFNETARKNFSISNLSDVRIAVSEPQNGKIVGIAKDFNFESLHVPIRAAGYLCSGKCDEVMYLKINRGSFSRFNATINQVEKAWNQNSPNFPFEYHFLKQSWEDHYAKDFQFQSILSYSTFISLLLSCFGLIGLTYYVLDRRTKEIGIRKVNGASESDILKLLCKEFIKWVGLAVIIATPITWYAMSQWLENFAYKTVLSWWIFVLAGLLALLIAILTVGWQSVKAAMRNPVKSLRYE
ncbi:ABC transporter permease [Thermophagus sp. OGC60D27]|uniref:ABC transporter permease n=1 Tax=Thermophagus sp. OGC60D27 TaxID=3458415 RepID=UPI004037CDF9